MAMKDRSLGDGVMSFQEGDAFLYVRSEIGCWDGGEESFDGG